MADHLTSSTEENVVSGSSSSKLRLVEDADRLSALPSELRGQILSFLPTIDAAKIGLLSKVWKSAWHSLSYLCFDYCQFTETENRPVSFSKFIDQTLAHHDESDVKILEVWLWPFTGCEVPIKSRWITFSIMHRVEKLVLYGDIDEIKLPDSLFTCQTLVELELAIPDFVLHSETIALPNLRKLKLKFLVLGELTLGKDPFSNLPALEKLSIFFCFLGPDRDISIASEKLEEFTMCCCPGMYSCSLKLQAPCLSNFIFISDALEKSSLDVHPSGFQFVINGGDAFVVSRSFDEFSPSLIKVTKELFENISLSFSHWLIEYLTMARDLPKQVTPYQFHNILKLDIEIWPIMDHVRVLLLLVSRCPNLNELNLVLETLRRNARPARSEDSLVEYETAAGFHKVTSVHIENFGGGDTELLLVRFLLANMIELCLMRIVLTNEYVVKNMKAIISIILGYEKASEIADIIFD